MKQNYITLSKTYDIVIGGSDCPLYRSIIRSIIFFYLEKYVKLYQTSTNSVYLQKGG